MPDIDSELKSVDKGVHCVTFSTNRSRQSSTSSDEMPRKTLQTQLSIESPTSKLKECIFSFDNDTPMPEVTSNGARIRVRNAGVCYRLRSASSNASIKSFDTFTTGSPLHTSVRDTSLFPGYEVAGTVDELGPEAESGSIQVGDRVIVYPYEGHPPGYAEFISVPDVEYLVKIPKDMSMSVAAMLPSGALWAINTIFCAHKHVREVLAEKGDSGICKILLVGTGGLALWALRIVNYYWSADENKIKIVIASLRDEGISIAKDELKLNIVQWSEDLYEEQLVERTRDACGGLVDIVIDFSATSRSIRRIFKCLTKDGVLLISSERAEGTIARFSAEAKENNYELIPVELGSIDQLRDLVKLVSTGEIEPPPHHIFPADRANEALSKIGRGLIHGRAILEFPEEEEELED